MIHHAHAHRPGLKLLALICLLLAATAVGTSQAAVNLVTNPGFEDGNDIGGGNLDFTGWTTSPTPPSANFTYVVNTSTGVAIAPHGGSYEAKSGPNPDNPELLSQNIATIAGHVYEVSFWLADFLSNGDGNPDFQASFAGSLLTHLTPDNNHTTEIYPYTEYVYDVVATGASSALQFRFVNPPGYWLLDDVSVTDVTPEASSLVVWSVLGLVGVAVGIARRNRSLQSA